MVTALWNFFSFIVFSPTIRFGIRLECWFRGLRIGMEYTASNEGHYCIPFRIEIVMESNLGCNQCNFVVGNGWRMWVIFRNLNDWQIFFFCFRILPNCNELQVLWVLSTDVDLCSWLYVHPFKWNTTLRKSFN